VKGTIFTVQKALPLMGKGGSIILTGSSAGTTGAPAFTAYSASKAAVRNLARTWVEDLKGTGIRVNVLSPGAIATELATEALGEEGLKAYGSMAALQRMGDPAELGAAAAFLASSDSTFMTGSEVAVDGGLAQLCTASIPDEAWQASFALNLFAAIRRRMRSSRRFAEPRRG
jgi:NAD(P)-dependent dehydrogenase (short-subunit alcohol dehydrogenase family)